LFRCNKGSLMNYLQSYDAVASLPEVVLASLAMALLMYGAFKKGDANDHVTLGAVVSLGVVAALVIFGGEGKVTAFGGAFIVDTFARVMKVMALFGSAVAIVRSSHFMKRVKMARFEYAILVMLASVGMMMMISANDLISLYVGLELQSLSLYVVAAIDRDSAKSSEAGLKYFVLGALSSGMLLYGASLIYGFVGATGFAQIAAALSPGHASLGLLFGIVFLIAGLAFK